MPEVKIKIYSTPVCGYCQLAKDFLAAHHISFEEFDVSQNEIARQEMIAKTQQLGVPVILIEKDGQEEVLVGFQKSKLAEILNIN